MLGDKQWSNNIDRAVERAADRIAHELDVMVSRLPDDAAFTTAMEILSRALIERRPMWMKHVDLGIQEHRSRLPLSLLLEGRQLSRGGDQ